MTPAIVIAGTTLDVTAIPDGGREVHPVAIAAMEHALAPAARRVDGMDVLQVHPQSETFLDPRCHHRKLCCVGEALLSVLLREDLVMAEATHMR